MCVEHCSDEIYCQLCCVITKNPSADSRNKGWMLHLLCAGCFLPSLEVTTEHFANLSLRNALVLVFLFSLT